jgi:ADP-ribose pyrophosphatase YjhB (NUDIX family)
VTAPCNNTSVGVIVARDDPLRLLLIERRQFPYGFAPPAGHVDPGEDYPDAAVRELREEVGLVATDLWMVLRTRRDNRCRRPGGCHHEWQVYGATALGIPMRGDRGEVLSLLWADKGTLHALAAVTRHYLAGGISEDDWRRSPGLEPVWLDMLGELWWTRSPGVVT